MTMEFNTAPDRFFGKLIEINGMMMHSCSVEFCVGTLPKMSFEINALALIRNLTKEERKMFKEMIEHYD